MLRRNQRTYGGQALHLNVAQHQELPRKPYKILEEPAVGEPFALLVKG